MEKIDEGFLEIVEKRIEFWLKIDDGQFDGEAFANLVSKLASIIAWHNRHISTSILHRFTDAPIDRSANECTMPIATMISHRESSIGRPRSIEKWSKVNVRL